MSTEKNLQALNVKRRIKVIACEVLKDELLAVSPPETEIDFLDFGLHDYPQQLKSRLQLKIDRSADYDYIVLGYGNCGQGLVGLRASTAKLVIPIATDCIQLLLGSSEYYQAELQKEPGTFFLSKGWIDRGTNAIKDYQDMCLRYGDKRAMMVIREVYKNYHRVVLIDNGIYNINHYLQHSIKLASFINASKVEIIPGSLDIFYKMINGCWDNNFKVLDPGETVLPEMLDYRLRL